MDRLEEIRQRVEAATPGPWVVKVKGNTVESHQVMSPGNGPVCSAISPKTKNAQFIAHSREDIPYLLSEVDRLNIVLQDERKEHAEEYRRLRSTYIRGSRNLIEENRQLRTAGKEQEP